MMSHIKRCVAICLFLSLSNAFLTKPSKLSNLAHPRRATIRSAGAGLSMGAVSVGIVGATGAVGEEILKVLEQRKFPCSSLK